MALPEVAALVWREGCQQTCMPGLQVSNAPHQALRSIPPIDMHVPSVDVV